MGIQTLNDNIASLIWLYNLKFFEQLKKYHIIYYVKFQDDSICCLGEKLIFLYYLILLEIRPDTGLPQLRVGGQEQYLRSAKHLGRSSEAKNLKNAEKVKCDGRTDGPTDRHTDGPTDRRTDRQSMV